MKIFIAVFLSCLAAQTLALPQPSLMKVFNLPSFIPSRFENPNAPEHMPAFEDPSAPEHMPSSEIVDQFRTDIEYWFVRFQNFYDRHNAALQRYRMDHVRLIKEVFDRLLVDQGEMYFGVADLTDILNRDIAARIAAIGGANQCINDIMEERDTHLNAVHGTFRTCSIATNATFETNLRQYFYPTFVDIQNSVSTVPNSVIDVLSRGNVLQDERAIIDFLAARYQVIDLQWIGATSVMLGWEISRFEIEGYFTIDESDICLARGLVEYLGHVQQLDARLAGC